MITILLLSFFVSKGLAEEGSGTAIMIGQSISQYKYAPVNVDSIQAELNFSQSEIDFGIITPKFGINFFEFYIDGGISYRTLKQDEQSDCSTVSPGEECPKIAVPETSLIFMREIACTLGYEFGFLSLEYSIIQSTVQGNYYYNNTRCGIDEAFILNSVAAIVEYDILSQFRIGVDGTYIETVSGGTKVNDKESYITTFKISGFIKFVL